MFALSRIIGLSDIQTKNIYLPVQSQINALAARLLDLEITYNKALSSRLSGGCFYKIDSQRLKNGTLVAKTLALAGEIFKFTFISSKNIFTIVLPLKAIKTAKIVASLAYHVFFITVWFLGLTYNLSARVKKIHDWEINGCQLDIQRLTLQEQNNISSKIRDDIEKEMPSATSSEKNSAYLQILSYYARSAKVYGPILRLWVEDLLKSSNDSESTYIFLARDGIAPYEVARCLLKDKADNAQVAYLSRKVISWSKNSDENKEMAREYLQKMINPEGPLKKIRIVDIGFLGSMIDDIKSLIIQADNRIKLEDISFHYLVSHTEKAEGFIGCPKNPYPDIVSAGQNPAVHWLEDSHQGDISSSTCLVKLDDQVYPNTRLPGKSDFCVDDPLQKLLRRYALQASVDYAKKYEISEQNQKEKAVELFKQTLKEIKAGTLPLFITHI